MDSDTSVTCDEGYSLAEDGTCAPIVALLPCDPTNCGEGYECPDEGPECVLIDGYCFEDADCGFGLRCEVEANTCVPLAGDVVQICEGDEDCGTGMSCQLGVCVGCLTDLQCPDDSECVLGTCVFVDLGPAGDCLGLECGEGQRCDPSTGLCEPTCTSDEDCLETEFCAPALNVCMEDFRCGADEECATAQCVGGFCVGCTDDASCGSGFVCWLGLCFPSGPASSPCDDVTCGEDQLCDVLDGSCYPADGSCEEDEDCRDGMQCSFLNVCTGCSSDGDCRPGQRCLFSACIRI